MYQKKDDETDFLEKKSECRSLPEESHVGLQIVIVSKH